MELERDEQLDFFSEMSEYQISARKFFSTVLLDSLNCNFGLQQVLIMYFDIRGKFLSWTRTVHRANQLILRYCKKLAN